MVVDIGVEAETVAGSTTARIVPIATEKDLNQLRDTVHSLNLSDEGLPVSNAKTTKHSLAAFLFTKPLSVISAWGRVVWGTD